MPYNQGNETMFHENESKIYATESLKQFTESKKEKISSLIQFAKTMTSLFPIRKMIITPLFRHFQ